MNKIIVSMFVSLDGSIEWKVKNERPPWSIIYWSDELTKIMLDQLFNASCLVLGKTTYDNFSKIWPTVNDEKGYAKLMNEIPKYVVTNSVTKLDWNNSTIINDKIVEKIIALRDSSLKSLLIFGSSQLISLLMKENLIDEFKLFLLPMIFGTGKQLFQETNFNGLNLLNYKKLDSDIIYLHYKPKRA